MKYLALDIGNVLVYADFKPFLNKLSKQFNITLEEANRFLSKTQALHDLGHIKMSDQLQDRFDIKSQVIFGDLVEAWQNIIVPAYWLLELLDARPTLKIALLSNVGTEHSQTMNKLLGMSAKFYNGATKHFSCEIGARKPSLLYYQSFLALHPEWKGCGYVDDLQENLDASKQFGFRTHRFALSDFASMRMKDEYGIESNDDAKIKATIKALTDFIDNLPDR